MAEKLLVPVEQDSENPGSTFKNRTVSKKLVVLLGVGVVLIILLVAAVIGLAVALEITLNSKSDGSSGSSSGTEVCTTRQCAETATRILRGLNESVDPCEDFYQFACGNWIQSNNIDPGELE